MTSIRSLRRINYSQAVLTAGLLLALCVVMFRPGGADASLPKTIDVYGAFDAANAPVTVNVSEQKSTTADYDVILTGKKSPASVSLTGVPLVNLLDAGGVDTSNVQFVKIRFGTSDDSLVSLQPLYAPNPYRPPILLDSGKLPGGGKLAGPQIVPGQASSSQPLSQKNDFIPFSSSSTQVKLVPGKPGAKIMSIRIASKKTSKGQYKLTASVHAGGESGKGKSYVWYGFDTKNRPIKLAEGPSYTTTDAVSETGGTSAHSVRVVVIENGTGSTGQQNYSYNSTKKSKGSTKNPYPPTSSTGSPGAGSGTGFGTGTGSGVGQPSAPITPPSSGFGTTPQPSTPVQPTPQPTPPTTTPAPAPTSVDTTAITNAAQNVNGTGGLQTISGVLLAAPTVAAASGGSGSPISALPAPVASELNTIFKPVDSAEDGWAYFLAILLATAIAGFVREWVNP